jgi:hypothetical protein
MIAVRLHCMIAVHVYTAVWLYVSRTPDLQKTTEPSLPPPLTSKASRDPTVFHCGISSTDSPHCGRCQDPWDLECSRTGSQQRAWLSLGEVPLSRTHDCVALPAPVWPYEYGPTVAPARRPSDPRKFEHHFGTPIRRIPNQSTTTAASTAGCRQSQ